MQYLVAPINVETMPRIPGLNAYNLPRTEVVKDIFTDKDQANASANEKAKKTPGVQYGVFYLVDVAEAQAKLIQKKVDENGQIVPV